MPFVDTFAHTQVIKDATQKKEALTLMKKHFEVALPPSLHPVSLHPRDTSVAAIRFHSDAFHTCTPLRPT
jgi:hypothetical protein